MIRKLLATTAIATLISTGAMAQTQPAPAPETAPAAAPMVTKAQGNLASNVIGKSVYNGAGDDAENIGEVNDLVLTPEGDIQAVVIGVGGFLGIGQKDVAIEYDLIKWEERDGERFLIVETTADALKAQQDFDRTAYQPMPADADVAETKPATAEDLANAPVEAEADDAAPADDTAMAPAGDATAPADDTAAAPADDTVGDDVANTATPPADPSVPAADAESQAQTDEAAPAAPSGTEAAQAPAADDAATDETETAAIDKSSLQPVDAASISAEEFVGTTVYGMNDEMIGEIGDVALDGDKVDAVIIDVGGFLGIGEKPVAVGMDNLQFMTDEDGDRYLYTQFTKEQLEAQPAYDESAYAESRDDMRMVVPN